VKVPIETDEIDEKDGPEKDDPKRAEQTELSPEEERARVEAAIRAGEEAAERELKDDAEHLRKTCDDLQRQLREAQEETEAAKGAADEAAERLTRLRADWENYRKRTAAERIQEKERAAEGLVLKMLPVIDDMERACEHAGESAGNEELSQFVQGVEAVHDKMVGILGGEGVEVIDPRGEAFDPLQHQAVGREENADAYDETVAQVYQKGYRMGGKVIRAAMVTVTYGGPKRPVEDASEKDAEEES